MANYGLYYQSSFRKLGNDLYRVDILQKDYEGSVSPMLLSATPVVQEWSEDDPKAPIKGSSLTINILNEGSTPIENFYSTEDDTFKARLWWLDIQDYNNTGTLLTGGHGIQIDVSLPVNVLQQAKTITFAGNTYTVVHATQISGGSFFTIVETIPSGTFPSQPFTVEYQLERLLFEGFLVQDDFIEAMLDSTHEFTLSANDNLGLLKDVPLNEFGPSQTFPSEPTFTISYAPHRITLGLRFGITNFPQPADKITIIGTPIDGTYTATSVQIIYDVSGIPTTADIQVVETVIDSNTPNGSSYTITRPANFDVKMSLLAIIQCCLTATGLALNTNVYANIKEQSQNASDSFLSQTLVATSTFLTDDTNYDNCYNVLTNILKRFNMVLFQSLGEWHIIRWDELRLYPDGLPYFKYDSSFTRIFSNVTYAATSISMGTSPLGVHVITVIGSTIPASSGDALVITGLPGLGNGTYTVVSANYPSPNSIITVRENVPDILLQSGTIQVIGKFILSQSFTTGFQQSIQPLTGLTKRPFRPFKYDKETFNYKQTANLLKNANFQTLGALLRTYTTGSGNTLQTISEYAMPFWSLAQFPFASTFFIRVTEDYLGNEVGREAIIKDGTINNPVVAISSPIEVDRDDLIRFTFDAVTDKSQSGDITLIFDIRLYDGTKNYFVSGTNGDPANAKWVSNSFIQQSGGGWRYVITGGNTNQKMSVDIDMTLAPVPFDGILYLNLAQCVFSPPGETKYTNLNFSVSYAVNKSTKVIGQTHEDFQQPNTKNNEDIEIFVDSSPRNVIAGTLFLNSIGNLISNRVGKFNRTPNEEPVNLGQITTTEQLYWRRVTRTLLEGTWLGLIQDDRHISMLSITKFAGLSGLNFIFGKLSIDYRANEFTATDYEIYRDGETDADLISDYDFEYLYSTK